MAQRGKVFIFSAPSGAGKTTIVRNVLKRFPSFEFSVSATTRSPRDYEEHGKDYYFLTEAEFKAKIAEEAFLEWEEVYPGRFYGTLKAEVDRILDAGTCALFDVDVVGGVNVKRILGNEAYAFFIQPPSIRVLKERLEKRGTDSVEEIAVRVKKAERELQYADQFDQVVINNMLEEALGEVYNAIENFLDR